MADFELVVDRLRSRLYSPGKRLQVFSQIGAHHEEEDQQQQRMQSDSSSIDDPVPWSWVCMNLMTLLRHYPGGVTEAIALSSLQAEVSD